MQKTGALTLHAPAPGDTDRRNFMILKCSQCPSTFTINQNRKHPLPFDVVRRKAALKGWRVGRDPDHAICPSCNGRLQKPKNDTVIEEVKPMLDKVAALSPETTQHEPDDIDRQIFSKLDNNASSIENMTRKLDDLRAANELAMDQSALNANSLSSLYDLQLNLLREMRAIQETQKKLAEFIVYHYDDEVEPTVIEHEDEDEDDVIPIESRIGYGSDGRTRRLTPVAPVTVNRWGDDGVKIRIARSVWDDAGMPIHEGARIGIDFQNERLVLHVVTSEESGVGLHRINAQSVHVQSRRLTTDKSNHHPDIVDIKPGKIILDVF